MRALRFVKATDDGTHVIVETADGGEQFTLPLDSGLRDASRADLPRLPVPNDDPEPAISPREIQTRVRAGESPQALAEEHATTLARILRFAGPVLDERERIAGEARRARARRSTTEGQTVIFGEAVDERFGAHGIDASSVSWGARRREDGQWVIRATWHGGESEHSAEWAFQLGSRSVTPIDDTAAELLSDRPVQPVGTPEQRPGLAAAPPLAPGIVAFPAMPDARTGPLPTVEEVFDQEAQDGPVDPAPRPRAPRTASSRTAPSRPERPSASVAEERPAPSPAEDDTQELPLGLPAEMKQQAKITNLGVTHRGESDEERAARARIPSWDDILLGVRRKND